MQPSSLSTLESLPIEILDQIFLYNLIPEKIWVNSIHAHSAKDVSLPIAKLTYYVTKNGSQFCVEPFSLNRFVISRALHAHLKSMLQRVTVFNLGKESHAQALLRRAAPSMAACGVAQISLSLEHAGYMGLISQALEDVFFFLRMHFSNVLRMLEVLIDLILFAQPTAMIDDIPNTILDHRDQVREFFHYTSTSSHLDTHGLVEACLLGFVTSCNTDLLNPARPEASINNLNATHPLELRVPCLKRGPARNTLVQMELLNKYCTVSWVQTSVDRYGGPSGYIALRQRPGATWICCDLYVRNLIQYELFTYASQELKRSKSFSGRHEHPESLIAPYFTSSGSSSAQNRPACMTSNERLHGPFCLNYTSKQPRPNENFYADSPFAELLIPSVVLEAWAEKKCFAHGETATSNGLPSPLSSTSLLCLTYLSPSPEPAFTSAEHQTDALLFSSTFRATDEAAQVCVRPPQAGHRIRLEVGS